MLVTVARTAVVMIGISVAAVEVVVGSLDSRSFKGSSRGRDDDGRLLL